MRLIYTWLATIVALSGTVFNAKQLKIGFALWVIANSMWLIWDLMEHTVSRAFLDVIQLMLAIYGIYEWTRKEREEPGQDRKKK